MRPSRLGALLLLPSRALPARLLLRCPLLGCLLVVFLLSAVAPRRAGAVEIKIESPSFTFDSEKHIYRYQEARLILGDMTLEALEVQIFEATKTIQATGQLRVRIGTIFISADRADLNADSISGVITNARLYDSKTGYYVTAEKLRIVSPERFQAEHCTLTSCPPLVPGWKLEVNNIDYRTDDFATGTSAVLELGSTPVFWFPGMAWPTVQSRRSGLLQPQLSSSTSSLFRFDLGTRLELPYFFNLGVDHDLTLTPEYIENRGPALGAQYRYAFSGDQRGDFKIWGLEEGRARNPSDENDILPPGESAGQDRHPARYIMDWGHNQSVGENGRLVINMTRASDGQVTREYQYLQNYRPDLIYQATVSNQRPWGDVAATSEHASEFVPESIYANRDEFTNGGTRPLVLPRFTYGGGTRLFDAVPIGLEFTGIATHFVADNDISANAYVARPALTFPWTLGGGFELRGILARQFVDYENVTGTDATTGLPTQPSQGFAQTEGELELRATLSGLYPKQSGQWQAIKHRIVPRLIYNGIEDVQQPLADRVLRGRPAESLVTLRFDNSFLGLFRPKQPAGAQYYLGGGPEDRAPGSVGELAYSAGPYGLVNPPALLPPPASPPPVQEMAQLNLIQRYNLLEETKSPATIGPALPSPQETKPGEALLPAILAGKWNGAALSLNGEIHYHHQLGRVTESNLALNGSVRRFSRLSINYTQNEFTYRTPENKLHPVGNSLGVGGELEFTDRLTFGFNGVVDLRDLPPPLDRRVQTSELYLDFHPFCYRIRLSAAETLELTQQTSATGVLVDTYFVTRRISLTLDLGGLFNATRVQSYNLVPIK